MGVTLTRKSLANSQMVNLDGFSLQIMDDSPNVLLCGIS